jgi:Flp pilus assembly protein TadD
MSGSGMRSNGISAGNGFNAGGKTNLGNMSGGNTLNNHSSFTKSNFPNSGMKNGAVNHQVNRFNSSANHALNNNAFVRSQKIANGNFNNHSTGNWNHWNNHWGFNNGFFFNPWWGYGGLGLWGLGFGYGGFGYGGYGYGNSGYGYDPYGYGDGSGGDTVLAAAPPDNALAAQPNNGAAAQGDPASAANFIDQGEIDFKAGKYQAAARDWQHALVDDPKNGGVMMLMAQTLLALGQYDDAAGATQAAMQMLPEDKWSVVVSNYTQLYGNAQDYTDELKALEKARDAKPESPALHFLLGFHFGYLNYPKNAVTELDKTLTLAPKDLGARKLRDIFAAKWPDAPPLPAAAVEAAEAAKAGGQKPAGGKPANPLGPSGGG